MSKPLGMPPVTASVKIRMVLTEGNADAHSTRMDPVRPGMLRTRYCRLVRAERELSLGHVASQKGEIQAE
jgi:hypothetical protein